LTAALRAQRSAAIVAFALLVGCGGATTSPVVAVIDMQRALRECNDGQLAMTHLRSLFEIRQRELDQRQGYLVAMRQQIDAQRGAGTDTTAAEAQYQQELARLQGDFSTFQAELQRGEQEATADILQRMQTVLTELAAERGVDVVIDRQYAPMVGTRVVDLTDEVVRAYNQRASLPPSSALVH
jgi:outer membrane protein